VNNFTNAQITGVSTPTQSSRNNVAYTAV